MIWSLEYWTEDRFFVCSPVIPYYFVILPHRRKGDAVKCSDGSFVGVSTPQNAVAAVAKDDASSGGGLTLEDCFNLLFHDIRPRFRSDRYHCF